LTRALAWILTMAVAGVTAVSVDLGSPVDASGDRPRVTDRDAGKEIVTVVEDSGHVNPRGREATTSGRGAEASRPLNDDGAVVVADPQCVATDPVDIRCMRDANETQNPELSAFTLAVKATNQLTLPEPKPKLVPRLRFSDGGVGGVVGVPMWLWIEESNWVPLTQQTKAGAAWANVTARPIAQVWRFGDGKVLECRGRGETYHRGLTYSRTSTCSYRYSQSSRNQEDARYVVHVTVLWEVTWVGSGNTSGTLGPLELTTSFPYVVREARAELVSP
jgi:hypothetical protein